jgi:hypothetical protein
VFDGICLRIEADHGDLAFGKSSISAVQATVAFLMRADASSEITIAYCDHDSNAAVSQWYARFEQVC